MSNGRSPLVFIVSVLVVSRLALTVRTCDSRRDAQNWDEGRCSSGRRPMRTRCRSTSSSVDGAENSLEGSQSTIRVTTMEQLKTIRNGEKVRPTFSASEMNRRLGALRAHMAERQIDACLFHLVSQYPLLQRLPLLLLRAPLRPGGHAGGPNHDLRQYRWRPALAAHLRRQRRLHRLAPATTTSSPCSS